MCIRDSLITAYQAAAYSMRVDSVYILKGALGKAWDACKGRNWKLLPLALADYVMMNSYLLLRILTKIKPLNFVMYDIMHAPAARLGLVMLAAALEMCIRDSFHTAVHKLRLHIIEVIIFQAQTF